MSWTVDTLKEHLEALRKDDKAAVDAALASSIKALEAALAAAKDASKAAFDASERRLEDARHSAERAEDQATSTRKYTEEKNNEFRGQLADQAATFMPRAESSGYTAALQRQIDDGRSTTQKALDELRRLVWIAVGLAIAASVAIPLLLRK